jgi:hypothetical protein
MTDFPPHMKSFHQELITGKNEQGSTTLAEADFDLDNNVVSLINDVDTTSGGNPYDGLSAYDPDGDLSNAQTKIDYWNALITAIDANDTVEEAVEDALSVVDSDYDLDTYIDGLVDDFEQRSKGAFLRNVSRVTAGMFDIRSVMTSQFGMALANMEQDRQDQLNDIDARFRLQEHKDRMMMALQISNDMHRLRSAQLQGIQGAAGMQQEMSKMKIVAKQDQTNTDLEWEVRESLWDLDLLQNYGAGMLSALSGAPMAPLKPGFGERLVQNLSSGVGVATSVGMATGSIEAALGAGIGWTVLGTLFSSPAFN